MMPSKNEQILPQDAYILGAYVLGAYILGAYVLIPQSLLTDGTKCKVFLSFWSGVMRTLRHKGRKRPLVTGRAVVKA